VLLLELLAAFFLVTPGHFAVLGDPVEIVIIAIGSLVVHGRSTVHKSFR
jgi:hypothetical protein